MNRQKLVRSRDEEADYAMFYCVAVAFVLSCVPNSVGDLLCIHPSVLSPLCLLVSSRFDLFHAYAVVPKS